MAKHNYFNKQLTMSVVKALFLEGIDFSYEEDLEFDETEMGVIIRCSSLGMGGTVETSEDIAAAAEIYNNRLREKAAKSTSKEALPSDLF